GGVIFTWSAIATARSFLGTETLNTPSLSLSLPFAPVSFSMFAVSRPGGAVGRACLSCPAGPEGSGGGTLCVGGGSFFLQPTASNVPPRIATTLARMFAPCIRRTLPQTAPIVADPTTLETTHVCEAY